MQSYVHDDRCGLTAIFIAMAACGYRSCCIMIIPEHVNIQACTSQQHTYKCIPMQMRCGTQSGRTSLRSPPLARWQSRLTGRCVRLDGRLDVVEAAIVTYELSPMAVIHQLPMPATEQPIAVNTLTQAGLLTTWVVTDRPSPHSTARMLVRSVRPVRPAAPGAVSRHLGCASQGRRIMKTN